MTKSILKERFSAMILSAGFGTRLRPLTNHIPKPLAPLCGRPLLSTIIEKISSAGADEIVINLHHKAEGIISKISKPYGKKLRFVKEKDILGTGGGILNCRKFLSRHEFFVLHNGDIISDVDINQLISHHQRSGMTATLFLIDGTENKISASSGRITGIEGICGTCENRKLLTYSGISVFNRSSFDFFPEKVQAFSLIDVLKKMIEAGKLGALSYEKSYWNDIGSLEKYFSVHEDILLKKLFSPDWLDKRDIPIPSALKKAFPKNQIKGFISSSGKCEIRKGARLANCILLDGAIIAKNSFHKNEIIGRNFSIHRDSTRIMSIDIMKGYDFLKTQVSSLPEQGSSRCFYRINESGARRILMLSSQDDSDFSRFIKIGEYLRSLSIGVPQIFSHSIKSHSVIMEDLGNITLNGAMADKDKSLKLLKRTILFLVEFQDRTLKTAPKIVQREFAFEGLRWESEYFRDNFLAKFAGLKISKFPGIEKEFDDIAISALSSPQVLCHRDFQSQNIMLKDGRIRIVDFQGARMGPLGYDLMSLLRDAYIQISEGEIEYLMRYYHRMMSRATFGKKLKLPYCDFANFASSAALQRNMQALGAFSFLSLVKGKKFYLNHIPRGIANLRNSLKAYKNAYGTESVKQLSKALTTVCSKLHSKNL
ncbi:MAG TPA: sugar phosphate nucleotidyltransferase [Victivallales bacterium]|nr:sugar phosphate nucleotidyltransferase [Victivallales bacterium]